MSRSLHFVLVTSLAALAVRSALGCADGITPPPSTSSTNDVDASDGAVDASEEDAPVDAPSAVPTCSADGWCYTKLPAAGSFDAGGILPDPSGVRFALSSVWASSEHRAWAVSRAGHVLQWNGTEWKVELVVGAGLNSVWGVSATDVWVAGDTGLLLHGTDTGGGMTFQPVSIGTTQSIARVWGTSASDVWIIADRAYHLTAETAGTATPFVEVTLPSNFGDAVAFIRPTAVWGTPNETWFAGTESSFCAPPSCTNASQLFAARRRVGAGGAVTWDTVPMPIADATKVVSGASTSSGVQVLALATRLFDTAFAARIADDASKLDPKDGPITVNGSHAWSFEVAEAYGQPTALWGREEDDVWLVGQSGVVRRFDGDGWQLVRVARTALSPLASNLNGIDGFVAPTGEREMWIVGEDVALRREVKP